MVSNSNRKYGQYVKPILVILDFLIINAVFIATCIIYPEVRIEYTRTIWLLVNISFLPGLFWQSKTRNLRALHLDHVVLNSIQAVGLHALFFLSLLMFLNIDHIPSMAFVVFYGMCFAILPLSWILSQRLLKYYRRKGRNFTRAIIVGTNATARRLQEEMLSDAGYGYCLLGFFGEKCPDDFRGKYLGDIEHLDAFIKDNQIDEIYYTLSGENDKALRTVIGIADNNVVQFYYVPQLSRYLNRGFELHNIGAVPILTGHRNPLKRVYNKCIKRAFDILFSSTVLLFSPIIFIPVAIAIKLSSPGPVFFKQIRTGYRGRDFYCWKFRTMKVNADSDKKQASKDDPRKTKVGDFLRKTSIDELPQFINVFLGDMSIVGPRPHMLKHTHDYSLLIDKYMVRHFIKPGITGWAQVNGYRGLTEELWQMEKRVEYDVWYIENWSFMLDLKIIVRTVLNAVHGEENAF